VNNGESVLITDARIAGTVTVNPGGALTVVKAQISRAVTATARASSACAVPRWWAHPARP
jgi:hypothetical protein